MSTFDWAAKGPSQLTNAHKFNGVNTRKSVNALKTRTQLPFANMRQTLDHSVKPDDVPIERDQNELD